LFFAPHGAGSFPQGFAGVLFSWLCAFFLEGIEARRPEFFLSALSCSSSITVVIPIELFAQVPDPANEGRSDPISPKREALPRFGRSFRSCCVIFAASIQALPLLQGRRPEAIAGNEEVQQRFIKPASLFLRKEIFSFLAVQAAAHGFERLLCFEEGAESSGAVNCGA